MDLLDGGTCVFVLGRAWPEAWVQGTVAPSPSRGHSRDKSILKDPKAADQNRVVFVFTPDDGKIFHGSGVGDAFAPRCFKGDVMGCGIMFPRDHILDGEGEGRSLGTGGSVGAFSVPLLIVVQILPARVEGAGLVAGQPPPPQRTSSRRVLPPRRGTHGNRTSVTRTHCCSCRILLFRSSGSASVLR